MEQHTRNQAYQLFLSLLQDPLRLPYEHRNLLNKPFDHFRRTPLRNLQSWLDRVALAIEIQSNRSRVGVSDICDWLATFSKPESKMYFTTYDFLYD